MSPVRVQMSHQHPWRAEHPDAVIVDRRTRWGNPFGVGEEHVITEDGVPFLLFPEVDFEAAAAFRAWLRGEFDCSHLEPRRVWILAHIDELRGRDLACWCPLGRSTAGYYRCHADALLGLANGGVR